MTDFTAKISAAAMLALAALPIAALPASALAAPPVVSVKVADLDLRSAQGMTQFSQRADYAARDFCRDERALAAMATCRRAVKAELAEKVQAVRTAQAASKTFAAR